MPPNPQITKSPNFQIPKSPHPQIHTSPNFQTPKSSNPQIPKISNPTIHRRFQKKHAQHRDNDLFYIINHRGHAPRPRTINRTPKPQRQNHARRSHSDFPVGLTPIKNGLLLKLYVSNVCASMNACALSNPINVNARLTSLIHYAEYPNIA